MLDRLLIDLVPRILNGPTGRRWFGDGAPKWSQGRAGNQPRPAGGGRRTPQLKVLRRHGKGNKEALLLAEKIAACRPGGRCLSGACPECMRATQRFFVATNADLLARSSVSTVAVSVILRNARVADGELGISPYCSVHFYGGCAKLCGKLACGKLSVDLMFPRMSTKNSASLPITGRMPGSSSRRPRWREAIRSFASIFPRAEPYGGRSGCKSSTGTSGGWPMPSKRISFGGYRCRAKRWLTEASRVATRATGPVLGASGWRSRSRSIAPA